MASNNHSRRVSLTTKRVLGEAYDLEDIAYLFIEEELGRHDWVSNWKRQPDKKARLSKWTSKWHPSTDVDALLKHIDALASKPFKYG